MSVTHAQGFHASGVAAGLKSTGSPDVAVVRNCGPSHEAAAVFTSNRVAAAPVHWSRAAITDGAAHAVVLNSGGANACTGEQGARNAQACADHTAGLLDVPAGQVQLCSTGLIGEQLPMQKLLDGVTAAVSALSESGGGAAATAIMTTDTVPKQALYTHDAGWRLGGMAKGAGMLAPALATMLVVLTTDVALNSQQLDTALRQACRVSFDRADSDGCMSTNDTVLLMSSGASSITPDPGEFTAALTQVCVDLAQQLIADAEGASHEIAIRTYNAVTEDQAVLVSKTVSRSALFKTAIFGNDPNWGRVVSAVGTLPAAQAQFEPDQLNVTINGVQVCRGGGVGESRDLVDLRPRKVLVEIDLAAGDAEATVWTNDLTHDYVQENSAYSS